MSRKRLALAVLSGSALAWTASCGSTASNSPDAGSSSSGSGSGSSGGSGSGSSGGSGSGASGSSGSGSGASSSGANPMTDGGADGSAQDDGGDAAANCNVNPGYALQFEGATADLVQANIAMLPQHRTSRTIELWAYFDGTTFSWVNEHGLFEYGNKNGLPAGGCHEFGLNSTAWPATQTLGMLHPYGNCPPADNFFNLPAGTPKVGWLHLSFGYDAASNHFQFTVNGSAMLAVGTGVAAQGRVVTPESTWAPSANWDSNATVLSIGTTVDFAGPTGWQGKIDEMRVWNVFRTEAQILANMNVMLKGNEPGLIAYYKFDEGTGTTIADSTGTTANVATMKSATLPQWVPSDVPGPFTCAP
jgi:hypothetical protein